MSWTVPAAGRTAPPDWKARRCGVFVFHYPPEERRLVDYLGRLVPGVEARVMEDLGLDRLARIEVFIAATEAQFLALQPPGGHAERWAAALAYPDRDLILLKSPRLLLGGQPHYEKIFLHEVAHVALDQALRGRGPAAAGRRAARRLHVPRWLHEGYAVYLAGQWSPSREVVLTRAVLTGDLIPLGGLVGAFPEDERRAALAYAQSADLVHFLIHAYGKEAFHRFLEGLGKGYRFGRAAREAFGKDFHLLEAQWRRHLRRRYSWIPLLFSTGTLWFLVSLVFLAAYLRKRSAARARLEQWSEEEGEG